MIIKNYVSFLIGLFLSGYGWSQGRKVVNNIDITKININQQQANLIFDKLRIFPNNIELSLALITNGDVQFVGVRRDNDSIVDVENNNAVFEIGSITKVFTSTLLANFVLSKKIKQDDPIQNYLDFKLKVQDSITFKHLANHTSGFPRLPSNLDFLTVDIRNPYMTYDANKQKDYLINESILTQKPGLKHEYSNLGAGLLGYILAKISKSSYEDLLQKYIFEPYNMFNSTSKRALIKGILVKGLDANGTETPNWDFDALAGGGSILSTVKDLSKFALAQFNAQNEALLLTQKSTFEVSDNMNIGLGWFNIKRQNGNEVIWHNGGTGGYTSSIALDVNQKNGVIILSNVSGLSPESSKIDQLCFGLMKTLNNN